MQLLKAGTEFGGRYEIVRVLSAGGMGVVYEVLHKDTKRHRALKLMLPQLLLDDDMRARFTREGIVTAGIESEHLVEVFDVGIDAATQAPFLVMELLRGEDLGARLKRGERTHPPELLEILTQVTRALDRTHAAGIVHRDMKPENLFVTHRDDGSMRMRILDFGIAKLVDRTGARAQNTRSIGTPLYMAPEQMTGQSADIGRAADVYAMGHIAYTLLVGEPYFQQESDNSDNALGLMFKVSQGAPEPASKRAERAGVELPAKFDAWFTRMTQIDPGKRFASAGEAMKALRAALEGAPDVLPAATSARRKMAFSETMPAAPGESGGADVGLAIGADSGRVPRAKTPVPTSLPRPNETGAGPPSTRTLATPSVAPPARNRKWAFAAAIAAGGVIAALGYTQLGGSERAGTGVVTNSPIANDSASPGATTAEPRVTLGEPDPAGALVSASANASSIAPEIATTAPSASAPSTSPVAGVTKGGPRPPLATAKPSAPPPSTAPTSAPTVWGGPRR